VKKKPKTAQLQIRVSEAQKAALRRQARRAGMTLSDWVLSRALPAVGETFQDLIRALSSAEKPGYVLAELNDLLTRVTADEYRLAVSEPPRAQLAPYWENYVAAMIEHAAARKKTRSPLHLLTQSPLSFRRRNIFIDSSIGDRV